MRDILRSGICGSLLLDRDEFEELAELLEVASSEDLVDRPIAAYVGTNQIRSRRDPLKTLVQKAGSS
jgi:hypothetical protein